MGNRAVVIALMVVTAVVGYTALTGLDRALTDEPSVGVEDSVVASNTTMYRDRVGRPTVVGEVLNGREYPVGNVRATVSFYRNGTRLGRVTVTPLRGVVPGGGRGAFVARLPNETHADRYTVSVSFDRYRGDRHGELSTRSHVASEAQDQVVVTGSVTNTGGTRVENVLVVGVFYDAQGNVIGVRSTPPSPAALSPGETGTYRLRFRTLGQVPSLAREFDYYRITVVASQTSA